MDVCEVLKSDFKEIAKKLSLEIYTMSYNPRNYLLRVFIVKNGTTSATIDDCVAFDRATDSLFEEKTELPEGIVLEVSSPGIFRELLTNWHFDRTIGERIKIKFNKSSVNPINKDVGDFHGPLSGILLEYSDNEITMKIDNEVYVWDKLDIKEVNCDPII